MECVGVPMNAVSKTMEESSDAQVPSSSGTDGITKEVSRTKLFQTHVPARNALLKLNCLR